jgi:GAF domain-containing protein
LLAGVLEFALQHVECDWATIQLAGQQTAIVAASDPRLAPAIAPGSGEAAGAVDADRAVVTISGTGLDPRWPHGTAQLVGLGVRSVLVARLATGRSTLGTIAFHAAEAGSFPAADQATARLIAVHAVIAIKTVRKATNLAAAIESRTIIGQAQGIAMERYALDGEGCLSVAAPLLPGQPPESPRRRGLADHHPATARRTKAQAAALLTR